MTAPEGPLDPEEDGPARGESPSILLVGRVGIVVRFVRLVIPGLDKRQVHFVLDIYIRKDLPP